MELSAIFKTIQGENLVNWLVEVNGSELVHTIKQKQKEWTKNVKLLIASFVITSPLSKARSRSIVRGIRTWEDEGTMEQVQILLTVRRLVSTSVWLASTNLSNVLFFCSFWRSDIVWIWWGYHYYAFFNLISHCCMSLCTNTPVDQLLDALLLISTEPCLLVCQHMLPLQPGICETPHWKACLVPMDEVICWQWEFWNLLHIPDMFLLFVCRLAVLRVGQCHD